MKNLSKLLDMGGGIVDEVCKNPTKENANKLESVTHMTQLELLEQGKMLFEKYPTEENRKLLKKIEHVIANR